MPVSFPNLPRALILVRYFHDGGRWEKQNWRANHRRRFKLEFPIHLSLLNKNFVSSAIIQNNVNCRVTRSMANAPITP
jgi:hypothetical protein